MAKRLLITDEIYSKFIGDFIKPEAHILYIGNYSPNMLKPGESPVSSLGSFLSDTIHLEAEEEALALANFTIEELSKNLQWNSLAFNYNGVDTKPIIKTLLLIECYTPFLTAKKLLNKYLCKEPPVEVFLHIKNHFLQIITEDLLNSKNLSYKRLNRVKLKEEKWKFYLKFSLKNSWRALKDLFCAAIASLTFKPYHSSEKTFLYCIVSSVDTKRQLELMNKTFNLLRKRLWNIIVSYPGKGLRDYFSVSQLWKIWKTILKCLSLPAPVLKPDPSSSHLTLLLAPIWPWIISSIKKDILYRAFWWIETVSQLLIRYKPDVASAIDSYYILGKALAMTGKHYNIPTFMPTIGEIFDHPRFTDIYFDRAATYGAWGKENLVRRGMPPDKIVVTGAPVLDNVFDKSEPDIKTVCKYLRLNINKRDKIILFASQPSSFRCPMEKKEMQITAFAEALRQATFPWKLIVKLHPEESDTIFQNVSAKLLSPESYRIVKDYPLYPILSECDLLVTHYSTVGLEAAAFNKPVLVMNLLGTKDIVTYVEEGIALGAYSANEILPKIEAILYDNSIRQKLEENRKSFIERHLYKLDNMASFRMADAIEDLAKGTDQAALK